MLRCYKVEVISISWKYSIADTNSSRRFLKHLGDNFLAQVVKELARKGALLDLLPVNREGLMCEVTIGGHLGHHSDHEEVELKIFGDRKKISSKASSK